ncbi:hypothetical protein G7074_18090 [Pedobacter sp. HDW13]|uniref:hypothetical protein n=1 Tax=Pedobacter sp. HDW13 TaxID=2714940 RepID=UPI001408C50B|nr:hypothetical protein [Pedobacter sp. HDW13]QIL41006.1 hypothetical protein G7074_18090 [Pedobacter sp. HDW13]
MEQWVISYGSNVCEPQLLSEDVKKDNPVLSFEFKGSPFKVVFDNRSDYIASAYHTKVNVIIISSKGKKTQGVAVNVKKNWPKKLRPVF